VTGLERPVAPISAIVIPSPSRSGRSPPPPTAPAREGAGQSRSARRHRDSLWPGITPPHLVKRLRRAVAHEVLRVRGAGEVLAHELGAEQHRAQRPVVDHDPDRWPPSLKRTTTTLPIGSPRTNDVSSSTNPFLRTDRGRRTPDTRTASGQSGGSPGSPPVPRRCRSAPTPSRSHPPRGCPATPAGSSGDPFTADRLGRTFFWSTTVAPAAAHGASEHPGAFAGVSPRCDQIA